jgi:S1-C subfamily serine protease
VLVLVAVLATGPTTVAGAVGGAHGFASDLDSDDRRSPGPVASESTAVARAAQVGGQTPSSCNYTELYNRTIDSVVLLRHDGGQGSGFVSRITDNGTSYVTTNAHVLDGTDTVDVTFRRGEVVTGTVVGSSAGADLAVVRVGETPEYVRALTVAES